MYKFGSVWRSPPPTPPADEAAKELPVVYSSVIRRKLKPSLERNQLRVTWLGHASVLLQVRRDEAIVVCLLSSVLKDIVPTPAPPASPEAHPRPPAAHLALSKAKAKVSQ